MEEKNEKYLEKSHFPKKGPIFLAIKKGPIFFLSGGDYFFQVLGPFFKSPWSKMEGGVKTYFTPPPRRGMIKELFIKYNFGLNFCCAKFPFFCNSYFYQLYKNLSGFSHSKGTIMQCTFFESKYIWHYRGYKFQNVKLRIT